MPHGPWSSLPVIVSTPAGRGEAGGVERLVRTALPAVDLHFIRPSSLEELRRAVAGLARSGASRIVVAGGDGTLHHAVNALGDADVVLAPIPTGSGNDFCRGIGLGDAAAALRAISAGGTRLVDLLEVNGHRVCTVAGLGVVAETGVHAARLLAPGSPWRRPARALGQWTYLIGAAARLLFQRRLGAPVILTLDDEAGRRVVTGPLYGLFLANLPTLGAGLRLPVAGRADDGRFEAAWLPAGSRVRLVRSLSSLRSHRPAPAGALEVASVAAAHVAWEGGSALLADGEDLGVAREFAVRVLPRALRVPNLRT